MGVADPWETLMPEQAPKKAEPDGGPVGGSWRTAVPMLVVVAWLLAGLILISLAHWRRGTGSLAIALALAAGLRLFIAPEKLGPLVIRSKTFDVLFCLLLSGLLVALGFGWFSVESLN